jgi:hypothetical protein
MSILSFLSPHNHYWGIPHPRAGDNRLVQTCYECGSERKVKVELRPESNASMDDTSVRAA